MSPDPGRGSRNPGDPSADPGPFGLVEVTVWTLGALLLMTFSIVLVQSARPDATSDMVTLAGTSSVVFLILTAALLGRRSHARSVPAALGVRRLPVLATFAALGLGILVQFPALEVANLTERFFPIPEAEALEHAALLRPGNLPHALFLAVFLALLVPFAEEAFFRGALFGALRRSRHSSTFAAAATGGAFLLSHLDPHYWPALGLVAAVLSLLRAASGSLAASLAFHIGFNSYTVATTTFQLGGPTGDLALTRPVELALMGASLVVGGALWAFFRQSATCASYRELESEPELAE